MAAQKNAEDDIKKEVGELVAQENELKQTEAELSQDPRFGAFLQKQKEFRTRSELLWETIKNEMEANNIKSIKGEWGSITLAEKLLFDVDLAVLPAKFIKKMPDTKKIGDTFRLEGKAPKGAEPKYTKYLVRRIK